MKGSRDERGDGRRESRVYIAFEMVVWLFGFRVRLDKVVCLRKV
jgi:hypothetical protein